MNEHWLQTDEKEDLITSLVMLELALDQTAKDIAAWKWAVIATHSALQSAIACHFTSLGNHFLVAKQDDAEAWLKSHENGTSYPEMMMESFLNLYYKLKYNEILGFKFVPHGTQGRSVKMINIFRNKFVHFLPKDWSIEVSGLPNMCKDCLNVIQEINEHTLHWQLNDDQQSSLSDLMTGCIEKLERFNLEYST